MVGQTRLFTDVELSTARTSPTVYMDMRRICGVHLWWTGTGSPAGTLSLNVSNDGTNWTAYDTQAVSGAGSKFWDLWDMGCGYVNVTYASSSGGTGSAINGIALVK